MDDYSWVGPAISAVGNIGGGALSAAGSGSSDGFSKKGSGQQLAFQMQSIPAILNTYKKYGIHPLAAMGNTGTMVNAGVSGGAGGFGSDYGMARAMEGLGQDISRAQAQKDTPYDRAMREINILQKQQELENMKLQGQLLSKEINEVAKTNVTPLKVDDMANVISGNPIEAIPSKVSPADPRTGLQMGTPPAMQNYGYKGKTLVPGKSDPFAQATEEDAIGAMQYGALRVRDYLRGIERAPTYPSENPGKGYKWVWKRWLHVWEKEPIREEWRYQKHKPPRSRKKRPKLSISERRNRYSTFY